MPAGAYRTIGCIDIIKGYFATALRQLPRPDNPYTMSGISLGGGYPIVHTTRPAVRASGVFVRIGPPCGADVQWPAMACNGLPRRVDVGSRTARHNQKALPRPDFFSLDGDVLAAGAS